LLHQHQKWKEEHKRLEETDNAEYIHQFRQIKSQQLTEELDHILEKISVIHTHQFNFIRAQYQNELDKIQKIHNIEKQCYERKNIIQQRHFKSIHVLQAQQYREIIFSKTKRFPKDSKMIQELEEAEREFIQFQKTEKSNIEQILKIEEKKLESTQKRTLADLKLKYEILIIDANYKKKQDQIRANTMFYIEIHRLNNNNENHKEGNDTAIENLIKQTESDMKQLQEECETTKNNLTVEYSILQD